MFKHYLTAALRHFRRHKLTTTINVACLTIGLVCFLGVYATIKYLDGSDGHFENSDRINLISQSVNSEFRSPLSAWIAAKYLRSEFPEAEAIARATFNSGVDTEVPVSAGDRKSFAYIAYADPEFLDVFALPFLAGESRRALREPRSAVITHHTAKRLFDGIEHAVGRKLHLQDGTELTVRGVVGDTIQPSHIRTQGEESTPFVRFDVLISMDVFEASQRGPLTWTSYPYVYTYFVLPKDGSLTAKDLATRMDEFARRHINTSETTVKLTANPIGSLYFEGMGAMARADRRAPLKMFYFLGAVVLLVSCLNYANLATAQATTRGKEIGLRRVVGANRLQIATQFLMESALLSLFALLCALLAVAGTMVLMQLPGATAAIVSVVGSNSFWFSLIPLLLVTTLAAGAYPAFVLSRVRPVQAVGTGKNAGGPRVPRLLVIAQFAGACFLLISMLVSESQNRTVKQSSLEYSKDVFISVANNVRAAGVDFDVFQSEMLRQPNVKGVTASLASPWMVMTQTSSVSRSPDNNARTMRTARNTINYDFFATMEIGIVAGRPFERDRGDAARTDNVGPINAVIDRSFAEQNGWLEPQSAVGEIFYARDNKNIPVPYRVIGVSENRAMSLLTPEGARINMYILDPSVATHPIIRVDGSNIASTFDKIETVWGKLAPTIALKMRPADELINRNFQSMQIVTSTFRSIALLALAISVLGLIGMSFHVIGRRQHEVGVRKALGASVRDVVRLLLVGFSKPVVIANAIAWPFAYFAMQGYLSIFTERVGLTPLPFVQGFVVTLVIACAAVIFQSMRAARQSPATVLRHE